jgi:protein-S-isoprenylcysteine O-methyltransferase Ste14
MMPRYLAALTLVILLGLVLTRVWLLRRQGIQAMKFGQTHRTDFILPPLALFYFYLVFAAAFGLPTPSRQVLFQSDGVAWVGVFACLAGLGLLAGSLISFGRSFRVGIDPDQPGRLVTGGVFAVSRNPIYVALALILVGQFLIFPNWILLVYLAAAVALFHRQVLREEAFLKQHYGQAYLEYSQRVRRYL